MFIKELKRFELIEIIILIVNVALFLININLIFKNIFIDDNLKHIIIKSSDLFNINLYKNTYKFVSTYLGNKYTINNNNNKESENHKYNKKLIKIKSTGLFNENYHKTWLKIRLDDEFILSFDDPNPDYLIYNVFDNKDLNPNYTNAIRIAIYTENIMPDINYADYIMGHYHINYLDRYYKQSIFLWKNFKEIETKRHEVIKNLNRTKFCAAIISNCSALFRLNFIKKLNKYKKVDIEGKCRYNYNKIIIKNKIEFLKNYKFSIAMENSKGDGYISEKIVDSFLAGTIPIYYGDYLIDEFINPKTYILIKGDRDIDAKIEYIKKIDNDINLYISIMKENPIIDKNFVNKIDKKEIKLFLKNIFKQDKKLAFRRDNNYFDFNCENKTKNT